MPAHKRIYIAPSHTKNIFGNMRRVGKGFSGRDTPLFQTMMVQDQEEVGKGSEMPTDPHHTSIIIQPSTSQPQKKQRSRSSKRKDIGVPQPSGPTTNVADEAVNKEMDDSLVRAATTASSLEAEQDNGSGPRRQETIGDTIAQTRSKNVSKISNDPLLVRVLALETTKTAQANEIKSLKKRVKKLERRKKSRTQRLKRYTRITLVSTHFDADIDMFGVHDLDSDEVVIKSEARAGEKRNVEEVVAVIDTASTIPVSVATTTTTTTFITDDEITLVKALAELKSAKSPTQSAITRPKVKGIVFQESGTTTTTTTTTTTISSKQPSQENVQDKGKGKMVELEKPMKKKELIRLDEEIVLKLQAEFDKEVRLAREKAKKEQEANVALTEEWADIQAKIEADHELAQRLQAHEQEELSDAEKATLFVQLLKKRRKYFAAKRVEEKRNKPPTQAQQRKIMCTYLKNMEGKKPKYLKNKSFDSIQKMFDRAFKRVNTFVDFRTDLVEESSKRVREELEQENAKK
ncbi:hypothetical protein Tco_0928158 [Tanacetum coccineum]